MLLRLKRALRPFTVIIAGVLAMTFTFAGGDAVARRGHERGGESHERHEKGEHHSHDGRIERHGHKRRGGRVIFSRPLIRPGRIVRRLPRKHRRIVVRDREYYYRRGIFYYRGPRGVVVVGPPIGTVVPRLGIGFRTLWYGGFLYYYYGDIFYRRAPGGFVVVEPPDRTTVVLTPPTVAEPSIAATGSVSVTAPRLNVRTGPALYNPVISQVLQDEVLNIRGKSPGWLYVELPNGELGWVMEEFTAPVFEPASG
ncbi:MAG: DUF6515 family protein [Thermodesulfobacteriota bacterium]